VATAPVTDGVGVPGICVVAAWAVVDAALPAAAVSVATVMEPGTGVVAAATPVADPCGAASVDCPAADAEAEGDAGCTVAVAGAPVPPVTVTVGDPSGPTTRGVPGGVPPDAVGAAGTVAGGAGGVAVAVDDAGAPLANRPLMNPPMPQW